MPKSRYCSIHSHTLPFNHQFLYTILRYLALVQCVHTTCRSHYACLSKNLHLNRRFYYPRRKNTHSETVRAEDRAVTESVARSRALYLYPFLSGSRSLRHGFPRSHEIPLSSQRTFSISFTHADGIRKNVPRSLPSAAVTLPYGFNPSHVLSLFLSHSIYHSFSLVSSSFIVLISLAHVIRSLSSRDITPRLCLRLACSYGISHARIHPLARICLIPSRPVHARASDAECHAYPFCVRAIDARGKLSSCERNALTFFNVRKFRELRFSLCVDRRC